MKSDPLRVPDFLRHILEAPARIETYTRDMSKSDFLANSMAQDAVLRNIEIYRDIRRGVTEHRVARSGFRDAIPTNPAP